MSPLAPDLSNDNEPQGPTRRVFRPKLAASLIALLMFGCLLGLGTWQARRYQESTATIAAYSAQHDQPPLKTLGGVPGDGDDNTRLHALHFRRAELSGTLEADKTQLLTARYMFGRRGFGVMMPMRVAGGPLPRVLVYLGWVSEDKVEAYIAEIKAQPERTVLGRLQVPPLEPAQRVVGEFVGHPTWLRAWPKGVAATVEGIEPRVMLQVGVQAVGDPVDPEKIPLDGYAHPVRMHPSKHVEYAVTWYGLALTLVAVWFSFSLKKVPIGAVAGASAGALARNDEHADDADGDLPGQAP